MESHAQLQSTLAQRLSALSTLYQRGQASNLMTRALGKILAYETESSCAQLRNLQRDMAEFELQYGMTSSEFYRRYRNGETDDRMDFIEWASLVQMADNLRERLEILATAVQA